MKHKILITGLSGMLGVDLCDELRDGYEVSGIDIVGSRTPWVGSRFKKANITDKKSVEAAVKEAKPDIVIHAAAWTDVDGCELNPERAYKINSEGTKNTASACRAVGAALIYISTDFVFGGGKRVPYKEADKTDPLSVYADSKLKGEARVKRILKKYFILRTGWLYGRHGKNFVDTILKKAKTEKILKVVDDQVGSPTYTKDLAKAIHVLIDRVTRSQGHQATMSPCHQVTCSRAGFGSTSLTIPQTIPSLSRDNLPYGTYHISNAGAVSWFDYAKEILKLAGSQTKVAPISSKELGRPARRPRMSVLDNSKFIKFTGHKMRNWQEALKEYV